MATTTRKSKSSKPAAAKRLSDEELVAYVGKALAKDPQVSMAAIVTAIRTSGRSVSGGRVREFFRQHTLKPKTKRAAA